MRKSYHVILKSGDVLIVEGESLADLVEKLKPEGIKFKDVALIWLRVEVYDYHWR